MTYAVPLLYRAFYNYFYAVRVMKVNLRTADIPPRIVWKDTALYRVLNHLEYRRVVNGVHAVVEIHRNYNGELGQRRQALYRLPRQRVPIVRIGFALCPVFARPVGIETVLLIPRRLAFRRCRVWD